MDKILVFGDSIAYGKWDENGGWVAHLRKYVDEKYNIGKRGNLQVFNLGIPAELAVGLEKRFEAELNSRTSVGEKVLVIFATGVNDSCPNNICSGVQTSAGEFKTALMKMATYALKKDFQVVFVGLLPVNPAMSKGWLFSNEEVARYDEYISEVCKELTIQKLELFEKLMNINFPELLTDDSVHPNAKGHQILSEQIIDFLQAQKLLV